MKQIKIKSFRSVIDTGMVDVELEISVPTDTKTITIPMSEDVLRVCAEARGKETWSEPDIATVVKGIITELSEHVSWSAG